MTCASLSQARDVKPKAAALASHAGQVNGIGITKVGDSFAVKVNFAVRPDMRGLPDQIDDVPIIYEYVGSIIAR